MALARVAPVSMPRPVLGTGSWAPPGWRAGDLVLLRLLGVQDGVTLLQGAEGRVWRLPGSDPRLAGLPPGTPLHWTVVSTRPQLTLQWQGPAAASVDGVPPGTAAASTVDPPPPTVARPAAGPALSDLRPDAEILRLIHPLSAEATRLASQWRRQVLAGTGRGSDARERWRQGATHRALPWTLLADWLCWEDRPDEERPPPPRPTPFALGLGPLPLGLLLVEPDTEDNEAPGEAPSGARPLALRLMLEPPEGGPVVVQVALGRAGLRLRVAAAETPTLARLQQDLPELAGRLARLGLVLASCRLERLHPDMALWTPPAGSVRAARLPPLLFRAAAEICLALWADEVSAPGAGPRRASAQ